MELPHVGDLTFSKGETPLFLGVTLEGKFASGPTHVVLGRNEPLLCIALLNAGSVTRAYVLTRFGTGIVYLAV
jgi:hypothetical protein